jgi:adhesin transport system outer membrane protein
VVSSAANAGKWAWCAAAALPFASIGLSVRAQQPPPPDAPLLPAPSGDPMTIRRDSDPLLALTRRTVPADILRQIVAATVARAPDAAEAAAMRDEADWALGEAKAIRRPAVDLTITGYRVLSRNFGNNIGNIIEESRPRRRTDQLLTVDQLLLDGGSANARIGAARERLKAADADILGAQDRVVLQTLAAWHDVFTYRALVALSTAFGANQRDLRAMVAERIRGGAAAEADIARVDSHIASSDARLARFRRLEAQAIARFQSLTGMPPPAGIARAANMGGAEISRDLAVARVVDIPAVRAARSVAEAARNDARAAHADRLPTISAGVDAGRYGIYETPRDYDVRARLTLRQRLWGGIEERDHQAQDRARAAEARAMRISTEAARDAEIAWSDVQALEQQRVALEAAYLAGRRSRDTIAERFRVASGTLFDVIAAEDAYLETAAAYLQSVAELDAARDVLLSRTGQLLPALGIGDPARGREP